MPRVACCMPNAQCTNKQILEAKVTKYVEQGLAWAYKGDEAAKPSDREKYYDEAIKCYERGMVVCDRFKFQSVPLHYNLGNVYRKQKDYHAALASYYRAAEGKMNEHTCLVQFAIGLTCKLMGDAVLMDEKALPEKQELYQKAVLHYKNATSANAEFK